MSENNLNSEENEVSIDDSMEETLREIRGESKEEEDELQPDSEESSESDEEPPEEDVSEEESEEPEESEETEESEDSSLELDSEDAELEETSSEPRTQDHPPSTWRAAAKAEWSKIPAGVKAEIKKREEDAIRGLDQYRERAQRFDEINSIIQPYEPLIRAKGGDVKSAITGLMNTYYQLESAHPEQKKQLLLNLAQNYGIDLGVKQDAMQQALTPLQQEIAQLRAERHREQYEAQQRENQTAQSEIEKFANEANEDGSLKHPYFENVRGEMAALITSAAQSGRSMTISDAYDAATWSNPETRALILAEQSKSKESETQAKAKAKVADAKKSAKTNLSKKGSFEHKQPKPTGSIDDTLKETMASLKEAS